MREEATLPYRGELLNKIGWAGKTKKQSQSAPVTSWPESPVDSNMRAYKLEERQDTCLVSKYLTEDIYELPREQ